VEVIQSERAQMCADARGRGLLPDVEVQESRSFALAARYLRGEFEFPEENHHPVETEHPLCVEAVRQW
jgi:hypothetical protein